MKTWCWLLVLAGAILWAGCQKEAASAPPPTNPAAAMPSRFKPPQYHLNHAQPRLRTIKLWVGAAELETEVATTLTEISTGMMFRTNMTDGEGMLFVFTSPQPRGFYMSNCVVALSAGYIDAEGVLNEIVDLHPHVVDPVNSKSDRIKFVLEVPQGWFARHNVRTGMVCNTSIGPLKNLRGVLP
jgi:hypothetical protein